MTPEMVAMAELMLRDLPPNEVLTTSAIRPLINCLFVEYDRLKRVERAASALVDAINVSQLDLSNSVRDAYYDLHVLLNGDVT